MQAVGTQPPTKRDATVTRQALLARSEAHIQSCLRRHLPSGTVVFLYGSRARGNNRWNSDFDLWIDADIARSTLAEIRDELEESFIPFHVDLVTTPMLSGTFEQQVRQEAKRWM